MNSRTYTRSFFVATIARSGRPEQVARAQKPAQVGPAVRETRKELPGRSLEVLTFNEFRAARARARREARRQAALLETIRQGSPMTAAAI